MVIKRKHIILLVFILAFGTQTSYAQKVDAFARVQISPREGLVRQPYKVSIHVHSATWFAKPLQFQNLKIDNAFIIPFTRTVSGIDYINKKKYASLSFYYLVFPYKSGTLEIPELIIQASIPPEGDYKGIPVTIKTKAQSIQVNKPSDPKVWMVAKNATINESWSKTINNVKVGDVIERQISIKAYGTIPSLIQPLKIEQPANTSIYSKAPKLNDQRTAEDVNGSRIETYSYLFEKEGEIIIPEEEIVWVNPYNKRSYKRKLPEHTINVLPNPDLAMMASLKDSLMALTPNTDLTIESEQKQVPWKRISLWVIVSIITLIVVVKPGRRFYIYKRQKHNNYINSEAYYFKILTQSITKRDRAQFINALYSWYDKARLAEDSASIISHLNDKQQAFYLEMMHNESSKIKTNDMAEIKKLCNTLRTTILRVKRNSTNSLILNP